MRSAPRTLLLSSFLSLMLLAGAACNVEERRGIPPDAQATIDRVTEDMTAGRDEKVYDEAAEEWRKTVSAEENRTILSRARERLGRVEGRTMHSGTARQHASGQLPGDSLVVTYQTKFERGTGMETFTLLQRDGRWLLAGYSLSSDLLK